MLTKTPRTLPTLLTFPDTANELSCSVGKVYELVKLGKLEMTKLGPKTSRVTGASVERLVAERAEPDGIFKFEAIQNARRGCQGIDSISD